MCPPIVSVDLRVEQAEYAHDEILGSVAATRADLLVLGTHGRSGFQRLFLGSVTEKVIRKATCPTLVVPPRASDVPPDAPVQIPANSLPGRLLRELALGPGLRAEPGRGSRCPADPAARHRNASGASREPDRARTSTSTAFTPRRRPRRGGACATWCPSRPAPTAPSRQRSRKGARTGRVLQRAAAEEADLIVMGVHGRGAVDLLVFGSTTHHVIRAASCPVLVVRG